MSDVFARNRVYMGYGGCRGHFAVRAGLAKLFVFLALVELVCGVEPQTFSLRVVIINLWFISFLYVIVVLTALQIGPLSTFDYALFAITYVFVCAMLGYIWGTGL